ncbi:MAG: 1-acyl-sn-glycerol-3-phosphate acyltransferase [Parasporobacterium sp.]|nr:1-acyl-sn-glycerol-3-phosphate acyltransferase [Parasporobacterium sp.]
MHNKKTFYYSDPVNDDFAGTKINTITVDKGFTYLHNSLIWKIISWILYYIIAMPVMWIIAKIYLGFKVENRNVLRPLRKQGFFIYGNHTRALDAFVSPLVTFPQKSYVIAGADAASLPGLKNIILMLGVLPIPTKLNGMSNFMNAVSARCREGNPVTIYPEAHIWPFYTGIRPFSDTSFRYPVKESVPAVAMVVTYRKRKGLFRLVKAPGMTVTLSEPVYPETDLPPKQIQKKMHEQIFEKMCSISAGKEQVEYYHYEYVPKQNEECLVD